MLVGRKKCDFLLGRYEQSTSRTDLLERRLADLSGALKKNGGPYRCILECHEATMALSSSGREPTWQTLERPASVDRWVSGLFPALIHQISIQERQEILDIYSTDYTYDMLHHQLQGRTR